MSSDQIRSTYLIDPDVQLMLRVRNGDMSAFGELVSRYQNRLVQLFGGFFRDPATAEDLAQEVFLRVHRARERYQPTARFRTWLFQIAVNLAKNQKRHLSRRREVSVAVTGDSSSDGLQAMALDKSSLAPLRQAATGELQRQVREAVLELGERQRMAVLLSKFEGMPHTDVAAAMGLSEQAVKSLLVRARSNLRERLGRLAEEHE